MARRRRGSRHGERDVPETPSLAPAAPQALHRASVRSLTPDRRQFNPVVGAIHAIQKKHAQLVLARVAQTSSQKAKKRAARPNRVVGKSAAVRSRRTRRLLSRLQRADRRRSASPLRNVLRVKAPLNVRVCVQRKERREVIFAKGRGGSSKISRRRRRNDLSNIRCK